MINGTAQSLPLGGRWAGHQPGSDEGDLPSGIGRVQNQPRTIRYQESNPFGEAEYHYIPSVSNPNSSLSTRFSSSQVSSVFFTGMPRRSSRSMCLRRAITQSGK